ncbi:MAG: helix-turn-helix transcriptional regulator [Neisseriaceae bacterium]|nr:YafY family transcriptional regulator [Neisseriaceae bacterium]
MNRTERLMKLLQLLRAYRYPVSAQTLADELKISVRTVYRDLELLRDQGVTIQGEAGLGYVLVADVSLPPMTLSGQELEALVLGLRWVCRHADDDLVAAAKNLFHKIKQVVPAASSQAMEASPVLVGSEYLHRAQEKNLTPLIRDAIDLQNVLAIDYVDLKNSPSQRRIYPVALAYFNEVRLIIAWCETRQAFRNFRIDRIQGLQRLDERYQPARTFLLQQWFQETGIPSQDFYFDD